jgi:hypothetical protein
MSTVRVVRPRPLGVNDRIPVFWAGQEPSQELKAVDGGALYRHLVASSTPTTNRKRKRTQKYHAPKEVRSWVASNSSSCMLYATSIKAAHMANTHVFTDTDCLHTCRVKHMSTSRR